MNKIYFIKRTDKLGYLQYVSMVVCAKDEDEALNIKDSNDGWTTRENLKIKLLGVADNKIEKGIILFKFIGV